MALNKTALDESVLSNSERTVCRTVYRISLLAEAKKAILASTKSEIKDMTKTSPQMREVIGVAQYPDKAIAINAYLESRIQAILTSVKIPGHSKSDSSDEPSV